MMWVVCEACTPGTRPPLPQAACSKQGVSWARCLAAHLQGPRQLVAAQKQLSQPLKLAPFGRQRAACARSRPERQREQRRW